MLKLEQKLLLIGFGYVVGVIVGGLAVKSVVSIDLDYENAKGYLDGFEDACSFFNIASKVESKNNKL